MNTLAITPSLDGFSVGESFGSTVQASFGGASRTSSGIENGAFEVPVAFTVDDQGERYLNAFWFTNIGQPFNITLPVEGQGLITRKAIFVDGLAMTLIDPLMRRVTSKIEVEAVTR